MFTISTYSKDKNGQAFSSPYSSLSPFPACPSHQLTFPSLLYKQQRL